MVTPKYIPKFFIAPYSIIHRIKGLVKRGDFNTLMYEVMVYPFFSLNYVKFHWRHIFLSLLIHRCIFLTTTNGQQKSIAATNNRTIPLITDAFLLFVAKIHNF